MGKCKEVVEREPDCLDKRQKLQYVMCYARVAVQERQLDLSNAMKQGWQEVNKFCKLKI